MASEASTPFFSIITPTWNRLELVRETIQSVAAQTERDFEFIVVDDGSSAEVQEELERLSREHRFSLIRQENAGPGGARNRGATAARGRYLVFLDSDDVLYPWALATYRRVAAEFDDPSLIGARFFPVDFRVPPEVDDEPPKCDRYPDFLACSRGESFLGACNQIVRNDVFARAGGFTEQPINCEDHDFVLRIGTEPGFVRIQSPPTLAYRLHGDNLTAVSQKTIDGVRFLLRQEDRGHYPGGTERRRERRRILSKHVRPVSLACLAAGNPGPAWSLYRQTLGWNLAMGQWKYLLGFPARALFGRKGN